MTSVFSQTELCGNDLLESLSTNPFTESSNNYSGSIDPVYLDTFEPVVYNIFFWQVNDPNGQFDEPITLTEVLTAVAMLNIEYNPYNIFFKYRGYNSFNSEDNQPVYYYDTSGPTANCEVLLDANGNPVIDPEGYSDLHGCEVNNLLDYAKSIGKWKDDAFNVYVVNSSPSFSGVANNFYTESFIVKSRLTSSTLLHEVGHNFNLHHTHKGFDASPNCEHVTRDPALLCEPSPPYTIPCFNAFDAGDWVLDTAAVPSFYHEYCFFDGQPLNCGENIYYNIVDCSYVGNNRDCQGIPYVIYDEDAQNYMSYSRPDCRTTFSIGQAIRMRETIVWDPANTLSDAETEISSLYEPYIGVYYVVGPAPDPHTLPLFQPGFDYVFQSCNCANQDSYDCVNDPCEFDENNFQTSQTIVDIFLKDEANYSSITHPNHSSIYISQLSQYGHRRCYDNWNRSASFGSLTTFNDGVLNNNVSINMQDSTQINNPQLIDNLSTGLYKIQKNYNDGSVQETIILKEQNE